MAGVDVIGDVHGHADRLRTLLARLGYEQRQGVWGHRERTAVFVGDLIDRGPGQLDTLRLVRAMVEAGTAQIVLGNHEFNAVAYATVHPERLDYCRPHDAKHREQHQAFLAEVDFGSSLHRSIIDWFMTIPMWLDLDGLRVVQLYDTDDRPIDELADRELDDAEVPTYTGPEPVLFGHYWWRKESAEPVNRLATCVDYSVARGGVLRAYRWDGEPEIDEAKFVDC
jgi:hypothetical protein